MPKVTVVKRCFNRLEYTVQSVISILNNAETSDFELIIVNNASTDGTREWLDWISKHGNPSFFGPLRAIHLKKNIGDWDGLRLGVHHAHPDTKYIVQADNDILPPHSWLKSFLWLMEHPDFHPGALMFRRRGPMPPFSWWDEKFVGHFRLGTIDWIAGLYIIKVELFNELSPHLNRCLPLAQNGEGTYKILNFYATHMDKTDELQELKYPRGATWERYNQKGISSPINPTGTSIEDLNFSEILGK